MAAYTLLCRCQVTSITPGGGRRLGGEADLGMSAEHEAKRAWRRRAAVDLHVLADQGIGNAGGDIEDLAVLQDDRVFDLTVANLDPVVDRGERSDIGVGDYASLDLVLQV